MVSKAVPFWVQYSLASFEGISIERIKFEDWPVVVRTPARTLVL